MKNLKWLLLASLLVSVPAVAVDSDGDGALDVGGTVLYSTSFNSIGSEWAMGTWFTTTTPTNYVYSAPSTASSACTQQFCDIQLTMSLTQTIPATSRVSFWGYSTSAGPANLVFRVNWGPEQMYGFDRYTVKQATALVMPGTQTLRWTDNNTSYSFYVDDVTITTVTDNCPFIANPRQTDSDKDGIGDDCDPTPYTTGGLDESFYPGHGANNDVRAIAVQPDGRILFGGSFTTYNTATHNRIARLDTAGSIDTTFNAGTGSNGSVLDIIVLDDGKILLAGGFTQINGITRNYIARLLEDGSLDTAFDPGVGPNDAIWEMALQPDGKIVIVGVFTSINGVTRNRIARLNADGSLDAAFDAGILANDTLYSCLVQPDGKILVGGSTSSFGSTPIVRLHPDGSQDSGFTSPALSSFAVYSNGIAYAPDGKIYITAANPAAGNNDISRLNPDGSIDTSFNTGSYVKVGNAWTLLQQPDGKILLGGLSSNSLHRFNTDGSLDSGFSSGTGNNSGILSGAIQPDGKLLIGGSFISFNGTSINRIARISTGNMDNDNFYDGNDNCPTTSNPTQADFDGDTQGDACDADDDNDGVLDANDAFPFDVSESIDTDNDGTGNNADTDDDNDGVLDVNDKFPLDATKSKFVRHDTEADGDSDVLIRSASTGAWIRYSVQNAAIVGSGAINAYTSSSVQYVTQLDANGDGDADILTRNTTTGAWYLHQVENGAVIGTTPIYLYANLDQQFIGSGDFNNDGVDDVMLRSASAGYYTVFLLANHAVSSAVYYNAWVSASSVPQAVGDFDGDGTDDLLVRRTSDYLYFIFKTINGAVNNYYCACNIWANPDWTFQFAGDTNNDSIDDVIVRGTGASADGKWWAFRMNNFSSVLTTNLNLFLNKTAISVGVVGDYNGDGTVDVLTRVNNSTTYVSPIVNGTVTGNYWLYNFTSDQVIGK